MRLPFDLTGPGLVFALTAMLCAGLVGAGHGQTTPVPPQAAPPTSESLPLTQDMTQRLTLAVMVNGQGPFDFLVDTGSDRTVISRELAARLGLPPGGRVRIHESAGVDTVGTVLIDHLKVGARDIAHIQAPALGEANLGAAGMLGVDALKDQHLVMDFKAMRLSTSPSRPEPIDPNTVVVLGHTHYGQLILTNSKIRGVPVLVVLDSGSQVTVGNAALLRLGDSSLRWPGGVGGSRLYFHKRENRAVPADEINFPHARASPAVSRHDRITLMPQTPISQRLASHPSLQMLDLACSSRRGVTCNPRTLALLPDQTAINQVREYAHGPPRC